MKAFVIDDRERVDGRPKVYFEERPMPILKNERSVLVKVKAAGICGSDIHIFEGRHGMCIGLKIVPGHEFTGEVVEVGSAVTKFKAGDRVVHEPTSSCGECYACRVGQENVCTNLTVSGCGSDGGWQEYVVYDEKQWHHIPDWVSYVQAALIEPYTIAAQACSRAELFPGDVVLIHGAGPIGLMTGQTAKSFGATVIMSEIMEGRINLAREMGMDYVINPKETNLVKEVMKITNGEGPNVVIDCAGIPNASQQAGEILSSAGRYVVVASGPVHIDGDLVRLKALRVLGSRQQKEQFEPVISKLPIYVKDIDRIISSIYPFEMSKEAFAFASERHPETGKIVVKFD